MWDLQDYCAVPRANYVGADSHADLHADCVAKRGTKRGADIFTNVAPADRRSYARADGIAAHCVANHVSQRSTNQRAYHHQPYSDAYHWVANHVPDPCSNRRAYHQQPDSVADHKQPDSNTNINTNDSSQPRTNAGPQPSTNTLSVYASIPNDADVRPHHGTNGFTDLRSFSLPEHSDPSHR